MAEKKIQKRSRNKRAPNLAKLIRKHAYIMKGRQKIYLNVSAESEREIISRILIAIEDNMPQIALIAYKAGRTTIKAGTHRGEMYDDVVSYFGKRTNKVIDGEEIV